MWNLDHGLKWWGSLGLCIGIICILMFSPLLYLSCWIFFFSCKGHYFEREQCKMWTMTRDDEDLEQLLYDSILLVLVIIQKKNKLLACFTNRAKLSQLFIEELSLICRTWPICTFKTFYHLIHHVSQIDEVENKWPWFI